MDDTCWNQDPWPYEYPPGYSRGMVRPDRGWFTSNFLGGPRERMAITMGENVTPYWYVNDFPLAARDTQLNQSIALAGSAIVMLVATQDQASPAYRTKILQVVDETQQLNMERDPINDANRFGTGQRPFYLMRPGMFPPDFGAILTRAGNLLNTAVTVQTCLIGLIVREKTQ